MSLTSLDSILISSPVKSSFPRVPNSVECNLCGCSGASVRCSKCDSMAFCIGCDDMFHRHPKRRSHLRQAVALEFIKSLDQQQTREQKRQQEIRKALLDRSNEPHRTQTLFPWRVTKPTISQSTIAIDQLSNAHPSRMPIPPPRRKKKLISLSTIKEGFRKLVNHPTNPPNPKLIPMNNQQSSIGDNHNHRSEEKHSQFLRQPIYKSVQPTRFIPKPSNSSKSFPSGPSPMPSSAASFEWPLPPPNSNGTDVIYENNILNSRVKSSSNFFKDRSASLPRQNYSVVNINEGVCNESNPYINHHGNSSMYGSCQSMYSPTGCCLHQTLPMMPIVDQNRRNMGDYKNYRRYTTVGTMNHRKSISDSMEEMENFDADDDDEYEDYHHDHYHQYRNESFCGDRLDRNHPNKTRMKRYHSTAEVCSSEPNTRIQNRMLRSGYVSPVPSLNSSTSHGRRSDQHSFRYSDISDSSRSSSSFNSKRNKSIDRKLSIQSSIDDRTNEIEKKKSEDQIEQIDRFGQWSCKFCTFLNSPSSTVCYICCKSRENLISKSIQTDCSQEMYEPVENVKSQSDQKINQQQKFPHTEMEFDAAFIAEQIEIEKELERRKINEIRIENENRLLEQTGTANEDRKHQTLDKQSAADYLSKESPSIDCEAGLKDPIKSTKTNEQNSNETQEQLMAKLIEEKIVEQLNRLNLDRNGGDKEEKLWRNLSSTTVNSSSSSSVFSMYDFAKINDDKPILDDRDDDRLPLSSCSSSSTVVNKPETITKSSKQMIRLLREADREGFTIDDLDLALRICPNNPLDWLRKNWRNSIETIKRMLNNQIEDFENQTHSKEISENKTENDGSRITETEVGNALHKTKGNIWRTIEQCLQQYLMRRANKISDGKALQQSNATNSEDSITKRDEDEILMIKLLQNLSPIELREMESMLNEWHDRRSKQMNRDRSSKSVPRSKRKVPSIEDVEKRIRSYLSDGTTTEEELDREVARVFEKRSPFIDGLDSETDQTPTFTNDGDVSEIVKHHESIRMENDQIKQRIGTKLKDLNRRNDQKKFMFKVIDPLTETSSVDSFQSSIENNDEIDNQLKNHLQIVNDNQAASSVSPISLSEGSLKSSDVQQSRSLKPPSLDNLFRASSSTISSVAPTIILDTDLDEDSDRSFLSIIESKSPVKIEEKLLIRKEFEVLQSQTDGIVLERLQKSNDLIPIRIVSDDRIVATQSNQNKNLIHLQNPIATIPGKSRSLTELTSKNFDDKNDPMDSVPQKPVYSKLRGLDKLKKASIWNSTEIDSIENFNNSIKSDNSISSIKSEPSIRTEKLTEEINEQRPNFKKDKARKFIIEKLRSIGSTNSIDLIDDNDDDYDGENKDVPDEALNQNTEDNFKNIVEKKEKIKPIISMFWNNNNRERGQNPLEHNRDDYSYEFQWARTEFECELCARIVPIEMIVSMITCTHYSCLDCMREYLHNQIREQQRLVISCPFCDEPNISPENDDQVFEYLQIFDPFVRHIIDPNVYELFQRKVRDRALMRDPNFLWCIQCSSGFIVPNPKALSVICPDCRTVFCRLCKKLWKTQHLNVHCEQYAEWEKQNDLDYAEQQLNKHLKEFGIECPNCHFRYQLAKGGCMHFRCTQCSYDFCGGCYRPFKLGSRCFRAKVCERLGLHAHHPRNCLFYLRDKDVADLQKLLTENNIEFKKNSDENGGGGIKYDPNNRCQVMEQKEVDFVMKDKPCNRFVETAGLCRLHYKEYLGDLIYKNQIDPISIFTETELELTLKRENIRIPSKLRGEDYLDKLRKLILEKIPLDLN